MTKITEQNLEDELVLPLLKEVGWQYLSPEDVETFRGDDFTDVVWWDQLRESLERINSGVQPQAIDQAVTKLRNISEESLIDANIEFHEYLTAGITINVMRDGVERGETVMLVDWEELSSNVFVATQQMWVKNGRKTRRPDVMLYVNGLPLVVIELKNPADEKADVHKAYVQLQNYKKAIPQLFIYNVLMIASDGLDARVGSLTAPENRFVAWKSVDGESEVANTLPQIETLIKGMLSHKTFLDVARHFITFEEYKSEKNGITQVEKVKILAAYHQYYAVNKALTTTYKAAAQDGDQKAGVVWHTQGSGKSLSMVFYAGKLVLSLDNPTIVVLTDRNDLDEQLFGTFSMSRNLLRQNPVQAESRDDLREKLDTNGGGIIFTTIQKFASDNDTGAVTNRRNVIVMADEAHRSQYGFKARISEKEGELTTKYGFAKYLRDALPHASFIGFTGTPVEKDDANTKAVFGEYVDVYDIQQAVVDGSTVNIYYESRLAKIRVRNEVDIDAEVEQLTEGEELTASEEAKKRFTQMESIIGNSERVGDIAKDFVEHFEQRQEAFAGKSMFVAMSRRIAVDVYEAIIALRPEWHHDDLDRGAIKVVMTSNSSDPENWEAHNTSKADRKELAERLKDPDDPLKIVIVRDMWLTGFDAPVLDTLYIDKPMGGHNLMQAIARVNRVYKEKEGGVVVDYIGIAGSLKSALNTYTESGGEGVPTLNHSDAVAHMQERYEIIKGMMHGYRYMEYFEAPMKRKLEIILETQDYIMGLKEGEERYKLAVTALAKAFALSVPSYEALEIKDELAFFEAVKARLVKYEPHGSEKSDQEVQTAIRQIVDDAISSDGIVDIFDAAGIKKPDVSILSEDFIADLRGMKHKNVAAELLKKLLADEVKVRQKTNLVQSKKLSEMIESAVNKYHNNMIDSTEFIEELIAIANEMKSDDEKQEKSGLSYEEKAFFDALVSHGDVATVMGDEKIKEISLELLEKVRSNASIDWRIKESVKAGLRVHIKRTLRKHGYPPDQAEKAVNTVLEQAELMALKESQN